MAEASRRARAGRAHLQRCAHALLRPDESFAPASPEPRAARGRSYRALPMHRDNPDVPVGEFVDVLNEHLNAGRIRAFGGSNWSLERVDAANDYAHSKGL